MVEELSPSFSSLPVTRIWSASRTKAETPRAPGVSGSVRAKRRNVPAASAVEMNCFAPAMCHPPSSRVGGRAQCAGVGSRLGLGQREGADQLAARQRRHEARPLLLGPEAEQRQGHGARVHGDRDADTRVAARELLDHEHVREEVGPGAAVLLGEADAHQPELGELREDVAREVVLAIPLGRVRLDLGADEVARERLDLLLLGRKLEVHQP